MNPAQAQPTANLQASSESLQRVREPVHLLRDELTGGISLSPTSFLTSECEGNSSWIGTFPALFPEWLGDRSFGETHGVRFPYVAGSMANGIASVELVLAMARAEMLAFLGTAGWLPERVEDAVRRIQTELEGTHLTWGANLIHSPQEPETEALVVDLYLRLGVTRIEASAFLDLSLNVVRYAATGLELASDGRLLRRNHVFAKISRPELAELFMKPAPEEMLALLVEQGQLTVEEAELARHVPIAEDVTVESDSGGHTDNRPLGALFPTVVGVRDRVQAQYRYERPIRVGAAGGLGTPASVAAAFALGADYVVTGTVNQSAVEAAISPAAKALLAQAGVADVIMAPAADMFEMGVKVQVLKRGSLFGPKGLKLYEIYRAHASLDALSEPERQWLEKDILKDSIDSVWEQTSAFFAERNVQELELASRDPKHRMALIFRWYLGKSSKWAISGAADRKMDYQIWCGPAMGAFNQWVAGSFLEPLQNRSVVQIALNLLEGAAVLTRAQQLRSHGVSLPAGAFTFLPRLLRVTNDVGGGLEGLPEGFR